MSVTSFCWEPCFRNMANETNRPILHEIHKTGDAIKRIKDINSASSISFLLDSTLATVCESSSSSSSSESIENMLHRGETTAGIWTMQLQLMAILAAMAGSPKIFPVQFNENAAWSCNGFRCLDTCQTFYLINNNILTPVQVNSTSCKEGLLEPACRMAYNELINTSPTTCQMSNLNNMTVAILNSNAHSHVNKRGHYRDYSPCHTFFPYRYALGLHNAKNDDLARFQSRDDDHNYISSSLHSQAVVSQLYSCVSTSCCTLTVSPSSSPVAPTATSCNVVYGDAAENLVSVSSINPVG